MLDRRARIRLGINIHVQSCQLTTTTNLVRMDSTRLRLKLSLHLWYNITSGKSQTSDVMVPHKWQSGEWQ
jgi:hypothetical protein